MHVHASYSFIHHEKAHPPKVGTLIDSDISIEPHAEHYALFT